MTRSCAGLIALSVAALLVAACTPSNPAASAAQAAFDAGQWERAAIAMADVSRTPTETDEARQRADYQLGVSLVRLELRAAGLSVLKGIAAEPGHAARADALKFVLPLALELPAAANVEAPLLQYDEEGRAAGLEGLPSPVQSRLRFLLGRFAYDNGDLPGAMAVLEKVKDGDRARALMLIAMCHVRKRMSVPAAKALEDALVAAEGLPAEEGKRLKDLANMQMAQIYYTAAFRGGDEKVVRGDRKQAEAALKYWKKIDDASPLGIEARWQRAWIELALGDQKAALDDARAAASAPGAYAPEAELLEASVRWGMKETDAATKAFQAFGAKYKPVHAALLELVASLGKETDPDAAAFALISRAKDQPDKLPSAIRGAVVHAVLDRRLLDSAEYGDLIEDERTRLQGMQALHDSKAGARAEAGLESEHKVTVRRAAELVRKRINDEAEQLQELLKQAEAALAP